MQRIFDVHEIAQNFKRQEQFQSPIEKYKKLASRPSYQFMKVLLNEDAKDLNVVIFILSKVERRMVKRACGSGATLLLFASL